MTDTQIKQNAKKYADGFIADAIFKRYLRDTYIAGAHSRDEEIKQLRKALSSAQKAMAELAEMALNPWISVEERLPEIGDTVVINVHHTIDGCGEHHEDDQILVENYNGRWICDRCEQNRMGKYLFDTISKTTHWMSIPQIEEGGKK